MKMLSKVVVVVCSLLLLGQFAFSVPYFDEDDEAADVEGYVDSLDPLMENMAKPAEPLNLPDTKPTPRRSCIRRGGLCDHRPNDCCFNSSCRCNLWGANCRCQRAGLFQKWGK